MTLSAYGSDKLQIAVKDSGPGIAPACLAQLFNPFQQVSILSPFLYPSQPLFPPQLPTPLPFPPRTSFCSLCPLVYSSITAPWLLSLASVRMPLPAAALLSPFCPFKRSPTPIPFSSTSGRRTRLTPSANLAELGSVSSFLASSLP